MDITFINSISLKPYLSSTHIGQMILKQILEPKYSVEIINFDYLAATGEFFYRDTINQNIEPMASIILKNRPKIVGFYTICHSFLPTLMLAKK